MKVPTTTRQPVSARAKWRLGLCVVGFIGLCTWRILSPLSHPRPGEGCVTVDRLPATRPDYSDVVIPPNIAPLNFRVEEPGAGCFVRVSGKHGDPIEAFFADQKVVLPESAWRQLAEANRGGHLSVDVSVRSAPDRDKKTAPWTKFKTITQEVASQNIDDYLVYRRIHPAHATWQDMGIYQRALFSHEEKEILKNTRFKNGCVNCHTFCNHRTDKMAIGIRSAEYGTSELVVDNGQVRRVGTKFGYTTWHPSGQMVTFSVNKVRQVFHSAANEIRDVLDFDSFMACYALETDTVETAPPLSDKTVLETYPTWSPDGKYLYFSRAPQTWGRQETLPEMYDQIRYDLVRVSYDIDRNTWGEVETVLSAEDTGLSILLPRISPDGRWLLVSMCDYGCFPVFRASSDLYLVDLHAPLVTGKPKARRLTLNSDASESWHSFSSNGRWIVFSSKRMSHIFTRPFIAYLDAEGQVHKPFVLPQRTPDYYDACLWTFSVQELIVEPIQVSARTFARALRTEDPVPIALPVTMATPEADGISQYREPVRE